MTDEAEVHAALEASEAEFRSVVEMMPAVPWTEVVDPRTGRGRFTFIGPQVEEVFGYSRRRAALRAGSLLPAACTPTIASA